MDNGLLHSYERYCICQCSLRGMLATWTCVASWTVNAAAEAAEAVGAVVATTAITATVRLDAVEPAARALLLPVAFSWCSQVHVPCSLHMPSPAHIAIHLLWVKRVRCSTKPASHPPAGCRVSRLLIVLRHPWRIHHKVYSMADTLITVKESAALAPVVQAVVLLVPAVSLVVLAAMMMVMMVTIIQQAVRETHKTISARCAYLI